MDEERADVMDAADACVQAVFGGRTPLAYQYHDVLATRGIEWGLMGPREAGRLWSRHILNSAAVKAVVPRAASVLDVGSGAGLPGIPLALARPDVRVTLLDSLLRRANFLELAVDELGLSWQAVVVRARAEDVKARYDVVVSRAVAPLPKLLTWCVPLMGKSMVALKGESAATEVGEAAGVLRQMRLEAEVVELDAGPEQPPAVAVVVTRR